MGWVRIHLFPKEEDGRSCPAELGGVALAATGGQVIEAAQAICEIGAKVERIVAVIDRLQGAGENITKAGYEFNALLTKTDLGITA